ncbi:MAG: radical SAM protein, partial [Candidatus Omnitrophota bacterium]
MLLSYPLRFINANVRRSFTCVSRPFLLNYCVTFKCNMRCIHCGCADAQDSIETGEELNVQHINKMVHDPLLRDLNVIVISGGEPFLKKDLNDILLVFQKKYKPYRFHITSNGLLSEIISESLAFYLRHNMKIDLKIPVIDKLLGDKVKLTMTRAPFEQSTGYNQRHFEIS